MWTDHNCDGKENVEVKWQEFCMPMRPVKNMTQMKVQ